MSRDRRLDRPLPQARWLLMMAVMLLFGSAVYDIALAENRLDQPAAVVALSTGIVDIQRSGIGRWEPAAPGDSLLFGDRIRTSAEARAVLILADGSRITLDEQTIIELAPPSTIR